MVKVEFNFFLFYVDIKSNEQIRVQDFFELFLNSARFMVLKTGLFWTTHSFNHGEFDLMEEF